MCICTIGPSAIFFTQKYNHFIRQHISWSGTTYKAIKVGLIDLVMCGSVSQKQYRYPKFHCLICNSTNFGRLMCKIKKKKCSLALKHCSYFLCVQLTEQAKMLNKSKQYYSTSHEIRSSLSKHAMFAAPKACMYSCSYMYIYIVHYRLSTDLQKNG